MPACLPAHLRSSQSIHLNIFHPSNWIQAFTSTLSNSITLLLLPPQSPCRPSPSSSPLGRLSSTTTQHHLLQIALLQRHFVWVIPISVSLFCFLFARRTRVYRSSPLLLLLFFRPPNIFSRYCGTATSATVPRQRSRPVGFLSPRLVLSRLVSSPVR